MKNDGFFYGFSWSWMEAFFTNERPAGIDDARLMLLAEALHHQYKLGHNPKIKLTHKVLEKFRLNRRYIRKYLDYLQWCGIIEVEYKCKSAPVVTLILKPVKYAGGRRG